MRGPAVVKVVATQVRPFTRQNIGSGIVIDDTGHIVTTTFEMETLSKIEVIFKNRIVFPAKIDRH